MLFSFCNKILKILVSFVFYLNQNHANFKSHIDNESKDEVRYRNKITKLITKKGRLTTLEYSITNVSK